jgi:CBS domain-containing protein
MQKLRDIMTRNVEIIAPKATVQEAAKKMQDLNVGALPVCDGDRLTGMITDRDLVMRILAEGRNPKTVTVSDAISKDVVFCFEDDGVEKASQLMAQHQIRRLPVMSSTKRLVGIVTLGDLAVHGKNPEASGDVLQQVSIPAHPTR